MPTYNSAKCKKSPRIDRLKEELYREMPKIEADRAVLLTESYMQTEGESIVTRRAKAFKNIMENAQKICINMRFLLIYIKKYGIINH